MYSYDSQNEKGTSATISNTGDKQTLTPAVGVEILSWGFVVTTAITGTNMIATCDKRVTAGTDTGRLTGTALGVGYGIMTLTTAETTSLVAGKVIRCIPNPEGGASSSPVEDANTCLPGQQAVINVGTAPSAGVGLPFIEFKNLPYPYQISPTGATAGVANSAYANEVQQSS